eukprot:comp12718_c0_seq1/m.7826 comp12718_c0_seq1/g.7826  ORF comp12718_c0_seq1/g.7826 comp12718_c0_seq1/m.7826 type:complete len:190 (-) comp12718_c0_seq1:342-911(-)
MAASILPRALALFALFASVMAEGAGPGRGFGDKYDWKTWQEALGENNSKPVMIMIHRTWCGACKALGPKFAESQEIFELSSKFTMINMDESVDPEKPEWSPDGGYVPRTLFLSPKGEVQKDIINVGGNEKYKYYYPTTDGIVKSMKTALERFAPKEEQEVPVVTEEEGEAPVEGGQTGGEEKVDTKDEL